MVDETVERMRAEVSPAHCTTAEGELNQDSEDLIDVYSEIPCLPSSESSSCPDTAMEAVYERSVCLEQFVCPVTTMEVGYVLFVSPELSARIELSVCPVMTMDVVTLSAVLPVLGVMICCVWAAYTIPESPGA